MKYSAAIASEMILKMNAYKSDWFAQLSCSEHQVKKLFTKLAAQKKSSPDGALVAASADESNDSTRKRAKNDPASINNADEIELSESFEHVEEDDSGLIANLCNDIACDSDGSIMMDVIDLDVDDTS